MLIVLLDEPGLFVFPTPEAAVVGIEAPDAESEIRAAFDERAVPYKVEWIRPNRYQKSFFGLFTSITFGEFRFVPAGPPNREALAQLLDRHPEFTTPPEAQAELNSLRTSLRAIPS